jgi:hypothetical protein
VAASTFSLDFCTRASGSRSTAGADRRFFANLLDSTVSIRHRTVSDLKRFRSSHLDIAGSDDRKPVALGRVAAATWILSLLALDQDLALVPLQSGSPPIPR